MTAPSNDPATTASLRPSVRDVAATAGVSVGTVSHVLNHPDRVAESTRKRVQAAIAELGFVRSETARHLRGGTSSLVGVVVLDISNPFFTEAARGIEDRLREDGCVPMLCSSDGELEREAEIMRLLAAQQVRGVIVTPGPSTAENLQILTERSVPVVLMDAPATSADISAVSSDDVAGARAALTHLLELGHRRIGFINGPAGIRQCADRRQGVLEAIREAGLDAEQILVEYSATDFSADQGAAGAQTLLDADAAARPTALFCVNDQAAIGAMREIRRRGLSIPQDVAIVGYDDISVAAELITPLTSVRQPMRDLGATAAELLLTNDDATGRQITFTPELVVRESTAGKGA